VITNQTRPAVEFREYVKSGAVTGQFTLSGVVSLEVIVKNRKLTPQAVTVGVAGRVFLTSRDGTERVLTCQPGTIYPLQGIMDKEIVSITTANTTADVVGFFWNAY